MGNIIKVDSEFDRVTGLRSDERVDHFCISQDAHRECTRSGVDTITVRSISLYDECDITYPRKDVSFSSRGDGEVIMSLPKLDR